MNALGKKISHDWFKEKIHEKTEFILNKLCEEMPFTMGYIGFILMAGKRIIRYRKSGYIEVLFRKKLPISTFYATRILLDIARPVCYRQKNRFYVRFLIPFIYKAFLTKAARKIFPKIIRENQEVLRGALTAIIDQYGKIVIGKEKAVIFRIPSREIYRAISEKIRVDKKIIRHHHARTYEYLVINSNDTIKQILEMIRPRNPEMILKRAVLIGKIPEEKAIIILRKIEKAAETLTQIYKEEKRKIITITEPDELEKAYILGFAAGDLNIAERGNRVSIRFGTTHPEALLLFHRILGKYGKTIHYIQQNKQRDELEIHLKMYLPKEKWGFLLEKDNLEYIKNETQDKEKFKYFLAGLFDAEGTIVITKDKNTETPKIITRIAMKNRKLLEHVKTKLKQLGIKATIYKDKNRDYYRLTMTGDQAIKLLKTIPIKHTEKTRKTKIAIEHHKKPWTKNLEQTLKQYKQQIKNQKRQLQTTIKTRL